jgi:4-amino-4-deoxy-L-arabinose transferase-like glycosyltransferase
MRSGLEADQQRSRLRLSRETLLLAAILVAAAALRLFGLNWDDGQWLHPDERQIYFVVGSLDWPHSLTEALSPDSPLNPKFFAYGSLPIYLLKLVTALLARLWPTLGSESNLHLVGRPLAVLFDLGTVYLTYRLARVLFPSPSSQRGLRRDALVAAALVGLAVLHVQLARFYTADPLLTFFVMLTLNMGADVAQGKGWRRHAALGTALGLTLATKVSAAPLILVVLVALDVRRRTYKTGWPAVILGAIGVLAVATVVFLLAQPYALIDWRTFVDQTAREAQIARGTLATPYTLQYAGTIPFLYSMWQTALWGLGLPLGLVAWAGLVMVLIRWLRRAPRAESLLLAWVGPYFVVNGLLYTRYLRYMLPLTPILCILGVRLLVSLKRRPLRIAATWGVMGMTLIYSLAFVSIYATPHSWVTASEWIYREVTVGSTLAVEHWDMALPLPLEVDGRSRRQSGYAMRFLALYDEPDDAAKWQLLAADLASSDYLVIASRRLYGSIPRAPDRYPVATRYYELLLSGELGFELEHEFTRGPAWLNPRLPPLPDPAPALLHPDESFVVYDHPRALVFRNAEHLPADELLHRLGVGE